jgi:hypothetical protein
MAAQHRLHLTSLRSEDMDALCQQSFWFAKETCLHRSAGEPNRWAVEQIKDTANTRSWHDAAILVRTSG